MLDDVGAVALADVCSPFEAMRPPRRVSVSQGAHEVLRIKQPGGAAQAWDPESTPYMVEPMDMLASRTHEALCFVGPARTGKTAGLLDGWAAHVIAHDPGDMLIVQMTQEKAREFSRTRIDRALRNSPRLAELMSLSAQDDNTHDKMFRHGMWLRIGWPTISQLSSSDYRYVALTDYDRMPDDIGGEGAAFALGLKRTTTYLSRGMCSVESSPGRDITDPNWRPVTAHEAPPTTGILGIYNVSDRRRWYWQCPDCHERFEAAPGLDLFRLPDEVELLEMAREADIEAMAAQYARVICPHCGSTIGAKHKVRLNRGGVWVPDGQTITADGELLGPPATSTIAGYWLGGVAAAYQSWQSLISRYLQGLRAYALTSSELTLRATTNTDQAMPYLPRQLAEGAGGEEGPRSRKEVGLARWLVPAETRFITAQVDVQGGSTARFVVQVNAHGMHGEQWVIDRYNLTDSVREGVGGGVAPIDPAGYAEDWDQITDQLLRSTYRTPIENRELRLLRVVVDTGGEDGVTDRAYAWYRRLRREGEHKRVVLVKGASSRTAPLIRESWVGGTKAGKGGAKARKGDVPLYIVNPDLFKDQLAAALRRTTPGPGYIHFPGWLSDSFFDELQAEVRNPKTGKWEQIRKRNESIDLGYMAFVALAELGADKIKDWKKAPRWAAPLEENSELIEAEERRAMKANTRVRTLDDGEPAAKPTKKASLKRRVRAAYAY